MATSYFTRHVKNASILAAVIASCSSAALGAGAETKPLVCSITINSDNEIKAFQKHLGNAFRFVELTDGQTPGDPDWFGKVCKQDIQCDVLVISGHFAGSFYGSRDFRLPIEKLEQQSCTAETNRCAGILARPKEVFLFGCNTLQQDEDPTSNVPFSTLFSRLRQSGMDAEAAVRVATTVKTGLYGNFGDRMRNIFSGASKIYGFTSKSPEGPNIAPSLERYLRAIPDYSRHLQRIAPGAKFDNRALSVALKSFAFGQSTPNAPGSAATADYQKVCKLYDASTTRSEGLSLIDELFKVNRSIGYFHAFEHFGKNNLHDDMRAIGNLGGAVKAREQISALKRKIGDSIPYASIYMANVNMAMGWITAHEYDEAVRKAALWIINTPTEASRHMARQIMDDSVLRRTANISERDLPADFPRRPHMVEVLGLLGINEPGIVDRMIENLGSRDETALYNRQALTRIDINSRQVDRILSMLAEVTDDTSQTGMIYLLSKVGCANSNPHTKNVLTTLAGGAHLQPIAKEQLELSMTEVNQRCG